jgi:hypothetical protein
LFDKTEEELDLLIKREINNVSNVQQVFGVYKNYHIVINNNWNKSKEIEQTNSIFIRKLNIVIFYKLVNLGATDEELLTFANYTI